MTCFIFWFQGIQESFVRIISRALQILVVHLETVFRKTQTAFNLENQTMNATVTTHGLGRNASSQTCAICKDATIMLLAPTSLLIHFSKYLKRSRLSLFCFQYIHTSILISWSFSRNMFDEYFYWTCVQVFFS